MRLIDTQTLHIQEFTGPKVPRYAILSHTWGNDELSYQDWLYAHDQSPKRWGWTQLPEEVERLKSTEGYIKVVKACEYARQHNPNCKWLWADTVCIDKTSSAELSEAINSMFEWYRRSEVCYALLVDVPSLSRHELSRCSYHTSPFRQSKWFRRGWTLQELVAPWTVAFLSKDWTLLGTKSSLAKHISTITSIPLSCLSGNWDRIREQTSIAQKMSWAAWRKTTRIEDQAYCLMGLFEINMPLLYGEGEKAFLRLQQEIIKQTEDLSFLAWRSNRTQGFARDHFIHWELPTLADSPSRFSSAKNVRLSNTTELLATKRVFTANTGTFIHRPLLATLDASFVFAPLNAEAHVSGQSHHESIWIPLVRDSPARDGRAKGFTGSNVFTRTSFPASTVFTALSPSRCAMYRDNPSEACLLPLYEPSSKRHYFRRGFAQGSSATAGPSHRQVCIFPVFASLSPWAKLIQSYPPSRRKDTLLVTLAEVGNNVYHGVMVLEDSTFHRGEDGEQRRPSVFVLHFLVIFDHDSGNRPACWNVKLLHASDKLWTTGMPTTDLSILESICHNVTVSILARANRGVPAEPTAGTSGAEDAKSDTAVDTLAVRRQSASVYNARRGQYILTPRLLARLKRDSESLARATSVEEVFVTMDSHWYTFRNSGSEESSFNTHVNLAMIGAAVQR